MKVIRAIGVTCDGAKHWNVFTNQGEARDWAREQSVRYPECGPHRVIHMVALDSLVRGLREAMKKHGCNDRCDVCQWAAQVIGVLWET
jgi:hypothetical protein